MEIETSASMSKVAERLPHSDEEEVEGCNIRGSATVCSRIPVLLCGSVKPVGFFQAHAQFLCQETQIFPQLKRHFVPESLMPALFLCQQMGPGFLTVQLKSLKGESLWPLEQFLLHYQRRDTIFLSPLAAAGVSNCLCRAVSWEL